MIDEDALRIAVDQLVLAGLKAVRCIPDGEIRSGCVVYDGAATRERLRQAVQGLIALSPVRSGSPPQEGDTVRP